MQVNVKRLISNTWLLRNEYCTVEALQNADCHHGGLVMCIVQLFTLVVLGGGVRNYMRRKLSPEG